MKTKQMVRVGVLVTLIASFTYWLGYQHGSSSSRVTLNRRSNLKQVGVAFRSYHNDIGRFSVTGSVAAPTIQTQER